MTGSLRAAQFTTDTLPRRVRYDAWRHLISAVFEPTMPNGHLRKDLRAEANVAYFGNALVVSTTAEAQHFTRSHRLIAAENLDHYLVQVYRAGVCEGTYGDVRNIVYPGDIKIIDLARPFHTFNTDFDNITLTLPRAALAPLLANPDGLHGTVLHRDTAEARLLAAHIEELAVSAAKLDTTVGHAVAAATLRLVAACLGPATQARDDIACHHAAAETETIRQYIDRNLASPALSPDSLAQWFRISRAQLYRAFPEDGGVQAYIRTQRLRRCFQAIADPTHAGRGIGEIALSFGFVSEAHFSRVFRQTFGLKPSEVRAQASMPPEVGAHSFISDWMRQLGRSPLPTV